MRELPEDLLEADWQLSIGDLREHRWDVAIVGAGPAGAMCALHLARAGRRVLLLDQARFPREKICGDGLVAGAFEALSRVGLLDTVRAWGRTVSVTSVISPSGVEFRIPAEYVMLERRVLDALVAREAVRSGAAFHHAEVAHVQMEPEGSLRLEIEESPHPVTARVLVVATGASVHLAREIGVITRPRASAVGARCYVRSHFEIDRVVGAYLRSTTPGYGWIFPMDGDLYNVGVVLFSDYRRGRLTNTREAFDAFIRECEPARRLQAEGEVVAPLRAAMLRCGLTGSRLMGPGNILAVGEAAGATLPLTGEGIGMAMRTGRVAAEVIAAAFEANDMTALAEYPRRIDREVRPIHRGYARGERHVAVPWVNDFMSWRVTHSPYLQEQLAALIAGNADPRDVFSGRAALRSLWR